MNLFQADYYQMILLFDGEPSSVYAATMFYYILPEFKKMKQEIVIAAEDQRDEKVMNRKLAKEFIHSHYPTAKLKILHGKPQAELVDYLEEQPQAIVVLGANRRGATSRLFKPSMVDILMKTI